MEKNTLNHMEYSNFIFQVKWNDITFYFQEIIGLDLNETNIVNKIGNTPIQSLNIIGTRKMSNLTFKKGIFNGEKKLWDKFQLLKMDSIKKSKIAICLLNENQEILAKWDITNAYPVKFSVTDNKSDKMVIHIESIEIVHEGMIKRYR